VKSPYKDAEEKYKRCTKRGRKLRREKQDMISKQTPNLLL
jgi:hypothetical protein